MRKLKVGMIGCGFIANKKHLPNLARIQEVDVVAFCNPTIEKARESAQKFGTASALVCTDYRDVLSRRDIDVIHICTPNSSHSEIAIAALYAGKHVMVEKPMAKTAAEAKAMLEASQITGKLLSISYQNRFREDSLFMKSLCERGELGEIYFAKAYATRRRGVPTWGVFLDMEKQGGGPLIDLATHALDLTLWMMDNYEPITVLGSTFDKIGKLGSSANSMGPWNPAKYEVEDSAFGMVRFKNGATVMIEASWALNMVGSSEALTLLCGTKAGADMFPPTSSSIYANDSHNLSSFYVRVNGERDGKLYIDNYSMGAGYMDENGKQEASAGGAKEMQAWINAVRGESELVVKPEQAYVVTCILEAIYKSALSGDVVHMGEELFK
jgi:predicted dehydrogenase